VSAELLRQALERVRFERLMGIETVTRVARATAVPVAAPRTAAPTAATPRALPPRPVNIAAPARPPVPTTTAAISKEGTLAERWQRLEALALACTNCPLHRTRTQVVFGTGNRAARLMFVGEGPGEDEDRQGEPFVGRAGQLLNKIIGAMGFKREEVYIANVVKCRPPLNRPPLPDEVGACTPYLFEQIELVQPQALVALGGPAAKTLLNTVSGIGALRGRWGVFRGIPVMPTFHPAFVLRTYTEEIRGQVWSDMKQVVAKLAALPAKG
jgi:DNA polymerase